MPAETVQYTPRPCKDIQSLQTMGRIPCAQEQEFFSF